MALFGSVVEWLNGEDEDQDVLQKTRIEAANVIASLAHGMYTPQELGSI